MDISSHYIYVAYSVTIDRYYVGETDNIERRLTEHNTHISKGAFTTRASDWKILIYELVPNRVHARKIELFIKKQKSRRFIQSFIDSAEIRKSIISKFMN